MIEVHNEPIELGEPHEDCVFCRRETMSWSVKRDVPVCARCAYNYTEADVPTKLEWVKKIIYLEDFQ